MNTVAKRKSKGRKSRQNQKKTKKKDDWGWPAVSLCVNYQPTIQRKSSSPINCSSCYAIGLSSLFSFPFLLFSFCHSLSLFSFSPPTTHHLFFFFLRLLLRILLAGEDQTSHILLADLEGVGAAHRVPLLLQSLHNGQEDQGAPLLAAVVLAKVNLPGAGLAVAVPALHQHELGKLVLALGGKAGRGALGQSLLQGVNRVLAEASTLDGHHRGVEHAGHNNVGHVER